MTRRLHDDALGVAGAETIIGTGVKVKGDLVSESDILIDGELTGTLKAKGDISVGVNGRVVATITATNVRIAGHLKGDITASGAASITETGSVEGNITSGGLDIAPGGVFIGRSSMDRPPLANPHTS